MKTVAMYLRVGLLGGCSLLLAIPAIGQDGGGAPTLVESSANSGLKRIAAGTFLQVEIGPENSWKGLAKGGEIEGRLALPVFADARIEIPEGTRLTLNIRSVRKARGKAGAWRRAADFICSRF